MSKKSLPDIKMVMRNGEEHNQVYNSSEYDDFEHRRGSLDKSNPILHTNEITSSLDLGTTSPIKTGKPMGLFELLDEKVDTNGKSSPEMNAYKNGRGSKLKRNKTLEIEETNFEPAVEISKEERKMSWFQKKPKKKLTPTSLEDEKILVPLRLRQIAQNSTFRSLFIDEYPVEQRERIEWLLQLWDECDYLSSSNFSEGSPGSASPSHSIYTNKSTLVLTIYESYFKDTKHSLKNETVVSSFVQTVKKYRQGGQKINFAIVKNLQNEIEGELKLKINSIWLCYIQDYQTTIKSDLEHKPKEISDVFITDVAQEEQEATYVLRAGTMQRIVEWLVWKNDILGFGSLISLHLNWVKSTELFSIISSIYDKPNLIEYSDHVSAVMVKQT